MKESPIVETLQTSVLANIWTERFYVVLGIFSICLSIYISSDLLMYLELMLFFILFTGIIFLGFIAIVVHIKYYFQFERRRKVELHEDKMVIMMSNQVVLEIFKSDILRIALYDQQREGSGHLFPTLLDMFYCLVINGKNHKTVVLTCLLDVRLKKKISTWYGQEFKHVFKFIPLPSE